ncbi:hypothetical protein [Persicobacter diffluens]|uniref:Uncharacterized protein n=1 Tax=Persicobacter diffluens TaxID=981 RepID=A0AAN5ALC9_9BACT|nr:hypothetical protein PEDI_32640 [Persicobacter diffluens]
MEKSTFMFVHPYFGLVVKDPKTGEVRQVVAFDGQNRNGKIQGMIQTEPLSV